MKFLKFLIRSIFFVVLLVIVVFYIYSLVFDSYLFRVKKITLIGVPEEGSDVIEKELSSVLLGAKFFRVDKDNIDRAVHKVIPNFELVKFRKKFPSEVVIDVKEREKSFVLDAVNGRFFLDPEGYVLGPVHEVFKSETNIIYDKPVKVGDQIEDAVLLNAMKMRSFNQLMIVKNGKITMKLDSGVEILLPSEFSDISVDQFQNLLQKMVQKYTIDSNKVELIDLRFSKPIIKYR